MWIAKPRKSSSIWTNNKIYSPRQAGGCRNLYGGITRHVFRVSPAFLGASLAGLAGGRLLAASPLEDIKGAKDADDSAFQPSTLFLTWQRDPTTTMTVQWVGAIGEA